MRIFKSNYDLLKRASPAKPGKRFVSFFIDLMVVFLLSTLLFLGGKAIVTSTNEFTTNETNVKKEVKYYNNFIEKTYLVEFANKENSERVSTEKMIYKNVCRAIYYSYNLIVENKFNIDSKVTEYGTSIDGDNIYLFYTDYVVNNNENNQILDFKGKTSQEYVIDFYKTYFGESSYYQMFDSQSKDIPTLNTNVAKALHDYLFDVGETAQKELGQTYYSNFVSSYSTMLDVSENIMLKSEPYYTDHYLSYVESITIQTGLINITLIICIMMATLLGVVLPKILFKDEVTIGRKITSLGVIQLNGEKSKPISLIIKSILSLFGFLISSIMIYILPPFYLNYDLMMMPFAKNTSFSFGLILIIIALIGIINAIPILFTHYKTSFLDMLFKTKVVDLTYLDEGDIDEKDEAMPL